MTENVCARRLTTNTFFITANSLIISALGLYSAVNFNSLTVDLSKQIFSSIIISIAGIVLCYAWARIVKSYRQLSNAKFDLIIKIENKLPLFLHSTEWKILGEGKDPKKYTLLTNIEKIVPWVFGVLYFTFSLAVVIFYAYSIL